MRDRIFIEFDKAGAEWVVVAYLTGDARMLEICQSGKSPHPITGSYITGASVETIEKESKAIGMKNDPIEIESIRREHFPELFDQSVFFLPRSMSIRQCGKKSNHGLNYMEGPGMFALVNEIQENEAKRIIHYYTRVAYPGLPIWWESVKRQLKLNRTLTTCFGRRRTFMDRWGNDLLKAAISFVPQSTVADMVIDGMTRTYSDAKLSNWNLGANVYDSLLFQVEFTDWKALAVQCIRVGLEYMNAECEYSGRSFRIGTDMKVGRSWGQMKEVLLSRDVDRVASEMKKAIGVSSARQKAA